MKLKLSEKSGISILTGTGEVTAHDVQVMRAGLSKLLKSGKNRIILDFPQAEKVPMDLLREISLLDVLARELSGRIVISGATKAFCDQISRFAQPPVIMCFDSKAAAIRYFLEAAPVETKPAPVLTEKEKSEARSAARTTFRQNELGEMHQVRTALAQLENENRLLREELVAATVQRRIPQNEAVYQERIKSLEQEVTALRSRMDEILSAK